MNYGFLEKLTAVVFLANFLLLAPPPRQQFLTIPVFTGTFYGILLVLPCHAKKVDINKK